MSNFNPKLFILRHIIKKLKEKHQNKPIIKKEVLTSKNNINKIMKKREFEMAMQKYLSLKIISYYKDLEEEKKPKKEFKFEKINFTFNDFSRSRNANKKFNLKKGIISKTNNLYKIKIDSTFEKIWKKLTPKNYEKFNNEFIYFQDKNKRILRRIKKEKDKMNSVIDLGINKFKKLFGDRVFNKTNNNSENTSGEDIMKNFIGRNINKDYNINISSNSTGNIIQFRKSFDNKVSNNNLENKIKKLRKTIFSLKNEKQTNLNIIPEKKLDSGEKKIKIRKIHLINKDKKPYSKLFPLKTKEKFRHKLLDKEKSKIDKYTRNKRNFISLADSEDQKSNIFQEYTNIIKTTKKMRLDYLENHLIPTNKVDSIMKTRQEMMINSLIIKYFNKNKKYFDKKEKKSKLLNFKERLIKSAEIFGDEEMDDL